jgi:hypothetical protein
MRHTIRNPLRMRGALAVTVLAASVGLGLAACTGASGGIDLPNRIAHLASTSERADDTIADGYISDSATVSIFDENLPAISNLQPDLRAAVEAATTAAGDDGQDIVITSGWRSAAYQQSLLDEATAKYGSYDEARKWVNTPELSAHVYGDAVDIGPLDAQFWLMEHGSDYGLCQTYTNERWHFEPSTEPGGTCPVQRSDAAG